MDKTLLKGLATLEALAESGNQALSIAAFAAKVGLTKSNAHRTLQTLAHAGYAFKDESSGTYRTSLKLFELGMKQWAQLDVRKVAQPTMQRLAEISQETVHLSLLEQFEVLYIDKIDSPRPVRAYTVVGGKAPAYCVATGKALLSVQSGDYLKGLVTPLVRHTPHTITSMSRLHKELEQVVQRGFAVNLGEWRESVGGVASPIFDVLGRPIAAIGLSGPLDRLIEEKMLTLAPHVLEAAGEISRALGYRGDWLERGR